MKKLLTGLVICLAPLLLAQAHSDPDEIPDAYYEQYDVVTPNGYPGPNAGDVTPGSSGLDTPDCPDDVVSAADQDIFSESGRAPSKPYKVKCNPPKTPGYEDP